MCEREDDEKQRWRERERESERKPTRERKRKIGEKGREREREKVGGEKEGRRKAAGPTLILLPNLFLAHWLNCSNYLQYLKAKHTK